MTTLAVPLERTECDRRTVARRFGFLVLIHAVLACSPLTFALIPADVRFLPLMWALWSIMIGQLMLMSFWTVMGLGRPVRRLATMFLWCAYSANWFSWPSR
ncbi:MAG TPA: hypothetical protein VHC22_03440 [Pirellulales bacterium]|nr:hypothetical protein [Pirellulales bacterium]